MQNDILVKNVCNVIDRFYDYYKQIIFIKSEYSEKKELTEGTHSGKNTCCSPGSFASRLHGDIEHRTYYEESSILVKKWYNAFKETDLDNKLKELCVNKLYIVGLKTNVCVKQTVLEAIQLGYNVTIIEGCTTATTLEKHKDAIDHMINLGATATEISDIKFSVRSDSHQKLGEGDCHVFYDVLPRCLSQIVFDKLVSEAEWKEMFHRDKPVSRLVDVQGTIENGLTPVYRFPNDVYFEVKRWSPTMKLIRDIVSERLSLPINHGKIQFYKDGQSHITAHSDKTLDIKHGSYIVNMSFGATRTFVLTKKTKKIEDKCYEKQKVKLCHNSIIMFGLDTNRLWTHSVPKEPDVTGERISIVFRDIATFQDESGNIIGQGANIDLDDTMRLVQCFSKENKTTSFNHDIYTNPLK